CAVVVQQQCTPNLSQHRSRVPSGVAAQYQFVADALIVPLAIGWRVRRTNPAPGRASLQTTQEIQQVLFLIALESAESCDHGVGLRRRILLVALALVGLDRLDEVRCPTIMKEEDPLAQPPQRRRPKLVRPSEPLDNVVSQPRSHSMQEQVRVQANR